MAPLFDLVLRHVAPPTVEQGPLRLLGTILEANPYLGRLVTGRITSGSVWPNQAVKVLDRNGILIDQGRVSKVLAFRGLERQPIEEGTAGDIVAVAGLPNATVSHTICALEATAPLPAQPIDPPTLAMTFRINDSPLAGTEGDKVQSRVIRERLLCEAEGNVALRIAESSETPLVRDLLRAHACWRNRGLMIDLVILNMKDAGYAQELQDQINRLISPSRNAWVLKRTPFDCLDFIEPSSMYQ